MSRSPSPAGPDRSLPASGPLRPLPGRVDETEDVELRPEEREKPFAGATIGTVIGGIAGGVVGGPPGAVAGGALGAAGGAAIGDEARQADAGARRRVPIRRGHLRRRISRRPVAPTVRPGDAR